MARLGKQWMRDGRALLAAVLLHALSLTTLRHFAKPTPLIDARATPRPVSEEQQVDLDLAAPLVAARAENGGDEATAARSPASPRVAASIAARHPAAVAPVPDDGASPNSASPNSEASLAPEESSEDGTALEPSQAIDLGVGPEGWRRWAVNPPVAPGSEAAQGREPRFKAPSKSNTGGLLEGLEEHDRTVGLTPSGRVRTALFNAAHSDVAPQLGVASFRVTVRNDGSVEVALHGATDSEQKWREVAERAAADLRKNPPRIPPPRSGTRMLVEIKAESVLPNGAKVANLHGTRVEVDPPRIRTFEESKQAVKDKNPAAEALASPDYTMPLAVDVPGVYLSHAGKVCNVRAGVTPFGLALSGGCDPSNIGAKPQRMVHTRIREESLF
ncbi:MAG TPA: hypothetical protein VFQ35_06410 [Polyangiaceae bacterium]|nr:hypothetical protein [Polyangiaceae bacterium]